MKLSIAYLGDVVDEYLNRDRQGVVSCVFEHSAYLDFDGTYLCLGLSRIGRGPINILYDQQVHTLHNCLRPNTKIIFHHTDKTLRINDFVIAQMSRSHVYNSHAKQVKIDTSSLNTRRKSLANIPLQSNGLLPLVATFLTTEYSHILHRHSDTNQQTFQTVNFALSQFALPIISDLASWIHIAVGGEYIVREPDKSICGLLGAGPGLTPSGDDLLAGVLLALRVTGYSNASKILWACLQPAVPLRTNSISAALLQQSAHGRAGEFALEALATYASPGRLDNRRLSNALARIGQTSGWDYFAGVMLVLAAVAAGLESTDAVPADRNSACF